MSLFNTYFTARFILSKEALINIVLSDRSDGKTFDCKLRALEDYEKDKSITIYMRRWKTEITPKMYSNFFDEVLNVEKYKKYSRYEFKGSKAGVQIRKFGEKEWDWIIYFVPLSIASKLKSQISDIRRIHTIDYDEFVPLDLRYLKDEVKLLLEFYKSIDRDRETTQLIILGNKVTPFNPLFDYFNLDLEITKEQIKLYKKDTIAVQIYANKEHRELRSNGKFNALIEGTDYEEYNNGGILNQLSLKIKSHEGYDYMCSFKTERGEGTIWYSNNSIVISETKRKDGYVICDKIYNIDRKCYQCNFGKFGTLFKAYYKTGNMYFETEKSFYKFEKILEKISSL